MKSNKTATWTATRYQHLYRHKSGKYYARVSLDGKQTWRSLKTDVLNIARPRLEKLLEDERERQELARGRAQDGSMTVGDTMIARLRVVHNDASIKSRTKEYYEFLQLALLRSWPELADTDVRDVTVQDCQAWGGKYARQVSATLFNNAAAELRKVLQLAVDAGLRTTNPASSIKRVKTKRKDLSSRLPDKTQFKDWIAEMRAGGSRFSRHSADLVEFLAYSGLRISEAKWVEWRHCDFQRKELTVVGDPVEGTKNRKIRQVPMIPALEKLLRKLRDERADENASEKVLKVNEAQKSMDRAGKKVGIARITHHDLRHLFATTCIESGVEIPTVARWLGHKDGGALAMKVYGHLRNEHSLAAAQKVNFG